VKGIVSKSSRTVELKCGFENKTKRPVRAMRGYLRFATFFNEPIHDLFLEAVMPLPAGTQAGMNWKLKREHFATDEAFKRFCDTPLDKMRQVWVPTVVVFEDGTTWRAK
jgi:hypothetical protein